MYESQITELREKLCKSELLLSDAQETANNLKEKDSTMRDKIDKLQRELDTNKMDTRRNVTSLQVTFLTVLYCAVIDLEQTLRQFCTVLKNATQT